MRGKAKWEHLNEDLHVLVTVEDAKNRATIKLKQAVEQVKKLLVPSVSQFSAPLSIKTHCHIFVSRTILRYQLASCSSGSEYPVIIYFKTL